MRWVTYAILMAAGITIPLGTRPALGDTAVAHFDLAVRRSDVLRIGKSHADVLSAFAVATPTSHGTMLTVDLFTRPIDAAARDKLSTTGVAPELNNALVGMLQLALDPQGRIRQVDLQYASPGATVGRTVASTPAELAQWSNGYRYGGGRLRLDNRGTYTSGPETPAQDFTLVWDMKLDIAVMERAGATSH